MDVTEFVARASAFEPALGGHLYKRSILSIRQGAGVIERVFAGGRYRRVLEIGTYRGISAAFIAGFCDRITTIDLHHGRMEQLDDSFDRRAFWEHMGVLDKIDLVLVDDDREKAEIVPGLDFDIAFIDGGKMNIESDFALVSRCGTVLFHDVDDRGRDDDYVWKFVTTRLPESQVTFMDIFALWKAA